METSIESIREQLEALEVKMTAAVNDHQSLIQSIHPEQRDSARNLLHYLVLRSEDIRSLQEALHIAGLSSLASAESHIHSQVQSVLQRLGKKYHPEDKEICDFAFSSQKISSNSQQLFGEKKSKQTPYIMVTFDRSFADNYAFIKSLLQNGMNVARINCAHDDEATWSGMINQVKKASRQTGIGCKIYMDLAGPKIRTRILSKGHKKGQVKITKGQMVWLAEDAADFGEEDIVISPGEKGIIKKLKKGDRVYIDDGKVKGVVEKIKNNAAGIRLIRTQEKGKIKEAKGINFPDTKLEIPSLTEYDKQCLPFICENADMVGYSFLRSKADLEQLQDLLLKLSPTPTHLIMKIETPEAVSNLPALLYQGMRFPVAGVMIARGDLAVEIGFERMGEIQDEILWICEAAHMPVVWATQVLESLNKSGLATRSEITDAAHAAKAECVMINKGEHTVEVIETLNDLLGRMGSHRIKKRYIFRPLNIARDFLSKKKQAELETV